MKKAVQYSAAGEIEKKLVWKENGFEKMTSENESENGVIEHSKKELEKTERSDKMFEPRVIGRALESDNC